MEVMLCRRICLAGVHVFRMAYLMMCFTGMNVTGGQVLLEGTSYRNSCLTGIHVLLEYMFYRMAYLTG